MNFDNHFVDLTVDAVEVGIKDAFSCVLGFELIRHGKRIVLVVGFLGGDSLHVKVGLTEELGGLELFGLLDVHVFINLYPFLDVYEFEETIDD